MLFFGPNEKKIEQLKAQNKLTELLKILDGLVAKPYPKDRDRNLFLATVKAIVSLSSNNEKLVCDTFFDYALYEHHNGNLIPDYQIEALLDAVASLKSSYAIKTLCNRHMATGKYYPLPAKIHHVLTCGGETSARILIQFLEESHLEERKHFLISLLGWTHEPAAMAYLINLLSKYQNEKIYGELEDAIVRFGNDAFDSLVGLLGKEIPASSVLVIASCLVHFGSNNAAPYLIKAKISLQKKNRLDPSDRKNLEKAIRDLGFHCTSHQWDKCVCEICGEIRDGYHQFDRQKCVCSFCQQEFHDWDVCNCRKCTATRHAWYDLGGRGIYLGKRCERCGEEIPWVRDD
jgi:hypothetical protein